MKKVFFILIILLAFVLRFYKLGQVPPSISWDEAAVGYNAWTIIHWGKDEWGKTLPLVFKSFEDYKHPVHIYLTAPFIAAFGLTEFGVRSSSAFFGTLNVVVIFFLARKIFKSELAGCLASFFLAVSPYNIHFSRFNHELNFALFFLMLGYYLILRGIDKKNYLIILGFASLGIDLLTYHSAKIIAPPVTLLISVLYFKDLVKVKKYFLLGLMSFFFFVSLMFIQPELLGGARLKQTSSPEERTLQAVTEKYFKHFTYDYLFVTGDKNPRLSAQTGEFYKVDLVFLAVGILVLLWGIIKGRKDNLIILAWALLAPLPAAVTSETPHAARAMFMTGSWHLIAVLGALTIINLAKNKYLKIFMISLIAIVLLLSLSKFLKYCFGEYARRYAIDWQYGMKDVVNYVKDNPNYYKVYMDKIRQQPYIFYLFYLKTPLPELLRTVKYEESEARSYNTVRSFGKYQFGGWDPIESYPGYGIVYVITPSYYSGLRFGHRFNLDKLIKYPNGNDAFYIVSGDEQ